MLNPVKFHQLRQSRNPNPTSMINPKRHSAIIRSTLPVKTIVSRSLGIRRQTVRKIVHNLNVLPRPTRHLVTNGPIIVSKRHLLARIRVTLQLLGTVPNSDFRSLPLQRTHRRISTRTVVFNTPRRISVVRSMQVPAHRKSITNQICQKSTTTRIRNTITCCRNNN